MAQVWSELLFAHWPVDLARLRALVPAPFELDQYAGSAWIGVVPFLMSGVRARWTPPLPWVSRFPELNVRTYVSLAGRPGVYFFSLDAANPLAVAAARRFYHLPYMKARMEVRERDGWIRYVSRRTDPGEPPAELGASYRPAGPVFQASLGSLESFLTDRYCLYTVDDRGRPLRGEIHHAPWPLQRADAEITLNTMAAPLGLELQGQPHLLFARRLPMVAWLLIDARAADQSR
jgi:uncharacterized protein